MNNKLVKIVSCFCLFALSFATININSVPIANSLETVEKYNSFNELSAQIDHQLGDNIFYSGEDSNKTSCIGDDEIIKSEVCYDKIASKVDELVKKSSQEVRDQTLNEGINDKEAFSSDISDEANVSDVLDEKIAEISTLKQTNDIVKLLDSLKLLKSAHTKLENFGIGKAGLTDGELTAIRDFEGKEAFEHAQELAYDGGEPGTESIILQIMRTLDVYDPHGNPYISGVSLANTKSGQKIETASVLWHTEKLNSQGDYVLDDSGMCFRSVYLDFGSSIDLNMHDFWDCNNGFVPDGAIVKFCINNESSCLLDDPDNDSEVAYKSDSNFALGLSTPNKQLSVFGAGQKDAIAHSAKVLASNEHARNYERISGIAIAGFGVLMAIAMTALHVNNEARIKFQEERVRGIQTTIEAVQEDITRDRAAIEDMLSRGAEPGSPEERFQDMVTNASDHFGSATRGVVSAEAIDLLEQQTSLISEVGGTHSLLRSQLFELNERTFGILNDVGGVEMIEKALSAPTLSAEDRQILMRFKNYYIRYQDLKARFNNVSGDITLNIESLYRGDPSGGLTGQSGNGGYVKYANALSDFRRIILSIPSVDEKVESAGELLLTLNFDEIAEKGLEAERNMNVVSYIKGRYSQLGSSYPAGFMDLIPPEERRYFMCIPEDPVEINRVESDLRVRKSLMIREIPEEVGDYKLFYKAFRFIGAAFAVVGGLITAESYFGVASTRNYSALDAPKVDPSAQGDPNLINYTVPFAQTGHTIPEVSDILYSNVSTTTGCPILHRKRGNNEKVTPFCDESHQSNYQYGIKGFVRSSDVAEGDEIWLTAKVDGGDRSNFISYTPGASGHFIYRNQAPVALEVTQGKTNSENEVYLVAYGQKKSTDFQNRIAAFITTNTKDILQYLDEIDGSLHPYSAPVILSAVIENKLGAITDDSDDATKQQKFSEQTLENLKLISSFNNLDVLVSLEKKEIAKKHGYNITTVKKSLQSIIASASEMNNIKLRNRAIDAYSLVLTNGDNQNYLSYDASSVNGNSFSQDISVSCENDDLFAEDNENQMFECYASRENSGITESWVLSSPDGGKITVGGDQGDCDMSQLEKTKLVFTRDAKAVPFNMCIKSGQQGITSIAVGKTTDSDFADFDEAKMVNISVPLGASYQSQIDKIVGDLNEKISQMPSEFIAYLRTLDQNSDEFNALKQFKSLKSFANLDDEQINILIDNGFEDAKYIAICSFIDSMRDKKTISQLSDSDREILTDNGFDFNLLLI